MISADFAANLQYLDLSVERFAKIVEVEDTLVAKWILGDLPVPRWVDALTYAWGENVDLLDIAASGLKSLNVSSDPLSPASVLLSSWRLTHDEITPSASKA